MGQKALKNIISEFVDRLYLPIFRRYMTRQTFRYGVCGGVNVLFDALLYFCLFQYVLVKKDVSLFSIVISPEIMAFLITFPIVLFTGFWLSKNISFEGSLVRTKTQSVRYLSVVVLNLVVKYWGLKLLIAVFGIYPSISNVVMTFVTILLSYLLQKRFTFKL